MAVSPAPCVTGPWPEQLVDAIFDLVMRDCPKLVRSVSRARKQQTDAHITQLTLLLPEYEDRHRRRCLPKTTGWTNLNKVVVRMANGYRFDNWAEYVAAGLATYRLQLNQTDTKVMHAEVHLPFMDTGTEMSISNMLADTGLSAGPLELTLSVQHASLQAILNAKVSRLYIRTYDSISLLTFYHRLQVLHIKYCNTSDEFSSVFEMVQKMALLTDLSVGCKGRDACLSGVFIWAVLCLCFWFLLTVSEQTCLAADFLIHKIRLPPLRKLRLRNINCDFWEAGLGAFDGMRNLQNLHLSCDRVGYLTSGAFGLADSQLTKLYISAPDIISLDGLWCLPHLVDLTILRGESIYNCSTDMADLYLLPAHVTALQRLQRLDMLGAVVVDVLFPDICRLLPALQYMRMTNTKLACHTSAIKYAVNNLPQLKYLEMGVDTSCYNIYGDSIGFQHRKIYKAFKEFNDFERSADDIIQRSAWVLDTLMMPIPNEGPVATAVCLKRR